LAYALAPKRYKLLFSFTIIQNILQYIRALSTRKNDFTEISKNLIGYRSENNFGP